MLRVNGWHHERRLGGPTRLHRENPNYLRESGETQCMSSRRAARLERCRKHVRRQGDLIDESEGLEWNEAYYFWVIWFEIPSSAIESGERIEDVLPRVLSDDENVDEVMPWVRKAVSGSCFESEEELEEGEPAAQQILEELSQFYS
jgi:hypothetical protein